MFRGKTAAAAALVLVLILVLAAAPAAVEAAVVRGAGGAKLKTPAEAVNYAEYSRNEAIGAFLSSAAAMSGELRVVTAGRTFPVWGFAARDIFLAVLTANGAARPAELDRGKVTILLTASQHGNEQSAKEAALRVIRDAALGGLKPLLDKINLLVVPQTNPYGNSFDVRENENGLDMNRDHIKLETEGARAIHRIFREWMPEVTIDVHEQGEDYYQVCVGCVSNANIDAGLQDFSRRVILAETGKAMAADGFTFHEYLVSEELGVDTSAGSAFDLNKGTGEMMMRHSTSDLNDGRNSLGIFGTISFIQEGSSRHDIATLKDRTEYQYRSLKGMLTSAAAHGTEINGLVRSVRSRLIEKGAVYDEGDKVHLRMTYARDPADPTLVIKEIEEKGPSVEGVLKVDKKAGEPLLADELAPYDRPGKARVLTREVKNWFPRVEPTLSVVRPLGYIIPGQRTDVVDSLLALGIEVSMVEADSPLRVESWRITDIEPAPGDYLAPKRIEVEALHHGMTARKGDFYVSCAQPAADLVPCLLEPQSEHGLIRYWKYKLVPEAGDIFPFSRVVEVQPLKTCPYKSWGR